MKCRKKAEILDAVQFEQGMEDGYFLKNEYFPASGPVPRSMERVPGVETTLGPVRVSVGDWITTNEHGEVFVCPAAVFEATYERVNDPASDDIPVFDDDGNVTAEKITEVHQLVQQLVVRSFGNPNKMTAAQVCQMPPTLLCLYAGLLIETAARFKNPGKGVVDLAKDFVDLMADTNADLISEIIGKGHDCEG